MSSVEDVVRELDAKKRGDGWVAKCPAHADTKPSLSIAVGRDGNVLLKCFVGCTFHDIKAALEARGIKLGKDSRNDSLPADAGDPGVRTVYQIKDASGEVVAEHVRIERKSGKSFAWRGPNGHGSGLKELGISIEDVPLYNTHLLAKAKPNTPVVIVEGEKAADALLKLGICALGTVTGASASPGEKPLSLLKGHPVYLWADNDAPGLAHMSKIATTLRKLDMKPLTIEWKDAPAKGDAADFVAAGNGREDVKKLAEAAKAKGGAMPGLRLLHEGVREAEILLDHFQAGDFSDRVSTGISSLDSRLMGGLRKGSMTLLGAPPGHGKTSIAQQIASHAAKTGPVLLVTPEMDLSELAEREIIRESGWSKSDRSPWRVKQEAVTAHGTAATKISLERKPIFVLDKNEVTMAEVEAAADSIEGLRLIIVDYAQQVADSDQKKQRYLQVGQVGLHAIDLGRKYGVPVLVASQVNRAVDGKETTYSFRETAILEHKAHTVLIFDVKWKEMQGTTGLREIDWAKFVCTKQRGGAPFWLRVDYDAKTYCVRDWIDNAMPAAKRADNVVALPYKD